MSGTGKKSRQRIVEKASRLIYSKGYHRTSFADIANEMGITKGNLHYHFPSKEALLTAVTEHRMQSIKKMLDQWDSEITTPLDRLGRFVQMLLNEQANLIRAGCPMGTLNAELAKSEGRLQAIVLPLFEQFRLYLAKNFQLMGHADADRLAARLLARAQGAALMAYIYHDAHILSDESESMLDWLGSLSVSTYRAES